MYLRSFLFARLFVYVFHLFPYPRPLPCASSRSSSTAPHLRGKENINARFLVYFSLSGRDFKFENNLKKTAFNILTIGNFN